ncbi:MAG: Cys-tRNA(Pro) deacylase [Alphaproteobacteria bacterium]|nr:Cys-tRNA(Pro) deacylase [Alphaproteobacteria bacterium]
MEKTNVMRILDKAKVDYKAHSYLGTGALSGEEVAIALNQNPAQVFKTLITVAKSKNHYVFLIPVKEELNLKKAAAAVGEKAIEMIKQKELLPLTGYIHGGCSPIGMKKQFQTTVDSTAKNFQTIIFSAGKVGYQVELSIDDLKNVISLQLQEIV